MNVEDMETLQTLQTLFAPQKRVSSHGDKWFHSGFHHSANTSLLKVLRKSLHKPQTAWPVLQSFSPTPGLEHIQTCKVTKPLLHRTAPQAGNKQALSSVVVLQESNVNSSSCPLSFSITLLFILPNSSPHMPQIKLHFIGMPQPSLPHAQHLTKD